MAQRPSTGNGALDAAMALLVQNQAALVAQQTKFLDQWAETRETFARIERDLETIKAVLVRHETMLEKLPEAIWEKDRIQTPVKAMPCLASLRTPS